MSMIFELNRVVVFSAIFAMVAFVLRELAAGVLRAAGQDAWMMAKRHTRNRAQDNRP